MVAMWGMIRLPTLRARVHNYRRPLVSALRLIATASSSSSGNGIKNCGTLNLNVMCLVRGFCFFFFFLLAAWARTYYSGPTSSNQSPAAGCDLFLDRTSIPPRYCKIRRSWAISEVKLHNPKDVNSR
jgi:hypothetical protein